MLLLLNIATVFQCFTYSNICIWFDVPYLEKLRKVKVACIVPHWLTSKHYTLRERLEVQLKSRYHEHAWQYNTSKR